ncbi:glycosyltransferase [Pyrobaculum sp. 3827-6]|uniref:glycosyltransferase n=1 Tax=Pyrobaculum sp. 3827-6 TaxID=2983604 RepID=UPI0021D82703|nr:glycosyltransferase [Pyrobaculum sp. 3827-6]MCU7787754.1 glycosyltransferase [Pyrobaculum sp. 3827-6]
MYAVVAHHYWGSPGGGQLVCAATAWSLDAMGYRPVLTGTFKFDPAKYREWYGIDLAKYSAVTLPISARAFGLWARLWVWRPAAKAIKKYKPDIVFIDEVTYKPLLKEKDFKLVEYIHFPFEVVVDPRFKGTGLAYGEDPYIMERYGRFPLNLYWKIFVKGLKRYMRENPFHAADAVLVNSKWTAEVAKMVYGERPAVLNPPLPPNVEIVEKPRPFEERKPWVVMLGRFSQEKRYHWVVTEVAPRLFKEVPEARLFIFGGAATPTLQAYKERVRLMAQNAGLKVAETLDADAQVYLIANAPRRLINEVMDQARAFLHATVNEHWGIAVAEAMARGLTPVVHKSGGTWTDLVEMGRYGMGYESSEEAVEALSKALLNGAVYPTWEKTKEVSLDHYVAKLRQYL